MNDGRNTEAATYLPQELFQMILLFDNEKDLLDLWQFICDERWHYCLADLQAMKKLLFFRIREVKGEI